MKSKSPPKYVGVAYEPRTKRYAATLYAQRHSHFLGRYDSAREGAVARDRAILHFASELPLQVARSSRKLGPASPDQLRDEATRVVRARTKTGYLGVSLRANGTWSAYISRDRRNLHIANLPSAEEAAVAHDRVELFFHPDSRRLNFPERRLDPISPGALRAQLRAVLKSKTTSKYRGVCYDSGRQERCWAASITVEYTEHPLGRWEVERDAAIAFDRAALFYFGPSAQLNLPALSQRLGPEDSETLLAEARRERKKRTSSRFIGVAWHKAAQKWSASIYTNGQHRYLGLFDDEVMAAEAYDHEAIKLRGDKARVNFDPASGKHVGGRKLGELGAQKPPRSAKKTAPATITRATRKRTR